VIGLVHANIKCADVVSDCTPQCNVIRVDNLGSGNVCTQGNYKCSPAPIRITDIKVNGLWYACRNDANKGQCNGRPGGQAVPTSCVGPSMRRESIFNLMLWILTQSNSAAMMESAI